MSSSPNGMFTEGGNRVSGVGNKRWRIRNLSAGKSYYVKVRSGSSLSTVIEVVTAPDGMVTGVSQTSAGKGYADLSWRAVTGASHYEVKVQGESGVDIRTVRTATSQIRLDHLNASRGYRITLTPIRVGNSFSARGSPFVMKSLVRVRPKKVTGLVFEKQQLKKHRIK